MVSSVLAQAILDQNAPDIVGAFKEGQKEAREAKTRELAGKAIATGQIDPILAEISPEIAFSIGEQIRARNARDISDFMRDAQIAKSKLDVGDTQGALQFAIQRRNAIRNRGGDTAQTDAFISTLQSNPEQARQELNAFLGSVEQTKPARLIERDQLLKDLESPIEAVRQSARIALKLEAPARAGLTPQEQVSLAREKAMARAEVELQTAGEIERLKAEQKEAGKGMSARKQGFIDAGVDAADGVGNIKRSLELLDTVKTGGISAASLRAKQLFGVEGADEGELSANLGIAVLSQLKPIFGAAFTKNEVEMLTKISQGFGKSTEANKRLLNNALKIAERSAKRGIKAAESEGDEFAAQEIRDVLEGINSVQDEATAESAEPVAPAGGIKFLGFE